ncbi:hypothetical protein [Pararhizobium sp.]|uniref:hypothetical protein n=1 Tax=Pararhizobium sp. TaxID=1977563 RepID=UPI003BAC79C9
MKFRYRILGGKIRAIDELWASGKQALAFGNLFSILFVEYDAVADPMVMGGRSVAG